MAASTPEIAVGAKIRGGSTAAGSRVNPQVNTQGPTLPFVTVTRLGAGGNARLSGKSSALKPYTVEVAHYAATQAAAVALAKQTRDLLAPDGTPWTDSANGVQGCFFQDSSEEVVSDESKDTPRVVRDTYQVWHYPT